MDVTIIFLIAIVLGTLFGVREYYDSKNISIIKKININKSYKDILYEYAKELSNLEKKVGKIIWYSLIVEGIFLVLFAFWSIITLGGAATVDTGSSAGDGFFSFIAVSIRLYIPIFLVIMCGVMGVISLEIRIDINKQLKKMN